MTSHLQAKSKNRIPLHRSDFSGLVERSLVRFESLKTVKVFGT